MNLSSTVSKNLFTLILLAIVSTITYSNAMHSGFLMDDHWMFKQDRIGYIQANLESAFFHKPIPEQLRDYQIDLSYRPLSQILPMLNYLIFKNNYFGYHVFNLILFIICVFMIYLFLQTLFKDFFISLTTALLFATHPINSLMVNYISAHIFSIQLLLMLSCCLTYIHYNNHPKNYLSLSVSLLTFYLATLCHEIALALPLFLTWLTLTILNIDFKNTIRKLWLFYSLGLTLTLIWFSQTLSTNEMFLFKDKLQISWPTFIAGLAQLWTWYITKLLFLHGVLLMYVLPVEKISLFYGWSILITLTTLFILTRHLWSKDKHIVWALGWFGIGLLSLIAGAKFQPAYGLTIEPHWLYFSSLGLFFIAAKGLKIFTKYNPRLPILIICFLVFAYSLASYRLNNLWSNEITYGRYFMASNPEFEKARLFLANAYFREGFNQEAEELYQSSFRNIPTDWMPYNNLGVIADIEGRYEEAAQYFQQLLIINPNDPGILSNLAIVYSKTDRLNEAEHLLQRAIDLNPWMLSPRINLASVYEKQNRIDDAMTLLSENLNISSKDSQTISLIVEIQLKHSDAETALASARRLSENTNDPVLFKSLGLLFCGNQHISEGYTFYKKAAEISPGSIDPNVCYIIAKQQSTISTNSLKK